MEEIFVVHIVVDLTMMFWDARWGRNHTGSRRSKDNFQRRCIRLAHISRRGDMLSPNVGLCIQLVILSTCSKRTERLAKLEPRIPSLMWEQMFHMRNIFSRKSHCGSGLVRSGLTSWHSNTYFHLYICKFQSSMHVIMLETYVCLSHLGVIIKDMMFSYLLLNIYC